jgi:beta-glucosidase
VKLAPGVSKQLTLKIDPQSLSSVDEQGNRSILEGKYFLLMGGGQQEETRARSVTVLAVSRTAASAKRKSIRRFRFSGPSLFFRIRLC